MSNAGRDFAAEEFSAEPGGDNAGSALVLMIKALQLLDDTDGPGDVGAHLDLAIHRLRDWISQRPVQTA